MKKITSGMLAVVMLLVSLINIVPINPVYASTEKWIEEDFIYYKEDKGHVIGLSQSGMEKVARTKRIVFLDGTRTIGNKHALEEYRGNINSENMFAGKKLEELVIPQSVRKIDEYAFYQCGLERINLPDHLEEIGSWAFCNNNLKEVYLPNSIRKIGGAAFRENKIEKANIPNKLQIIENGLFFENKLEEIVIPSSIIDINGGAFYRNSLRKITAPVGVKLHNTGARLFGEQKAEFRPVQNPFSMDMLGFNGSLGIQDFKDLIVEDDGRLSFPNDDIEMVELDFNSPKYHYSGTITIFNPHKWSGGTQTDTSMEDIENLEKEIKDLEKQIEELQKDKETNQDKIKELEEKLENCKDKGKQLIEEKKKLENQVTEKDKTIKELEEKIQDLENGDIEQIAELEEVRDEVKRLQVENEKLKEELSTAKWELEAEKEKTEASEEKIQELTERITQLENTLKEKDDEILSKSERIKELEDKLKSKEDEIKALQEQLEKVKADREKCCEEIEGLKKEIEEIKAKTEEDKKKLEEEITSLEKELKEQVERFNNLEKELNEKIEEARKKIEELEKKLEDKKATENESEDNKKKELEKILEDIKKRQDELEKAQKKEEERKGYKLEVDEVKDRDKEITGRSQSNWYLDAYRGNKRLGGSQADSRGYFTIRLRDEVGTGDKILLIAEDPKDKKESIEKEIRVQGSKTQEDKGKDSNKDMVKDKDITSESKDNSKAYKKSREFSVFQVGKDYYNIIKDGKKTTVYMDVKAYIQDDRIMLPVRYAAYTLGFNVEYDDSKREAIFSNKENTALPKKTLRLNIDTGVMKDSDGNIYHSDTKPVIINGRIHASISNIAKAFNATCGDIRDGKDQSIEWDNSKKAVYVFKNIK